ncbi:spore coat protein SP96 [Drosophila kikkawai]|uniref:Spore coat protein SP96 n=1 Tax=Drosophila kikkawai TaxID=30033 RepID=A0A6P4IE91_DROKI|nr:uncharacterized protein LOC108077675 [Drosophila kikkawai]KAH8340601.1 hypothetical protein KR059_002159 [Drosophila kikkawai]
MRAATIFSVIFVLAACLLRSSDAVTCTADASVANCIDCTDSANTSNAECVAEAEAAATTTTVAPTTTVAATEATTTATATTVASTATGGNRKRVRVTNMRFAVTRRIRIFRNRSTTARTTSTRNRNTVRRVNVRNRRGNGNVRVIVG